MNTESILHSSNLECLLQTVQGFMNKNDLVRALGAHFIGYNGRGLAGPSLEAYLARLNTLCLHRA